MSAWTELHEHFPVRPKTIRLAGRLGVPRFHVTGLLPEIWCYMLMHGGEDGRLSKEDLETCFLSAGWTVDIDKTLTVLLKEHLEKNSDGSYSVANWEEYAGRLMDLRKKWRQQKRRQRAEKKPIRRSAEESAEESAVESTRTKGGVRPLPNQTKPNRTKSESSPIEGLEGVSVQGGFEMAWKHYPRKLGKTEALRKWKRMSPADRAQLLKAVQVFGEKWAGATKDELTYCPHGSTWFNKEKWRDELEEISADVDRVKEKQTHEQVDTQFDEQPRFGD